MIAEAAVPSGAERVAQAATAELVKTFMDSRASGTDGQGRMACVLPPDAAALERQSQGTPSNGARSSACD